MKAQTKSTTPAKPTTATLAEQLAQLLTVKQVAEAKDLTVAQVRRMTRKDLVPGAVEVIGRVGYVASAIEDWEPPETVARITRREDGRTRFNVYMTPEELKSFQTQFPDCEVVDPKMRRKERRDARKAKKGAAEPMAEVESSKGGDDPFEAFGA